MERTALNDLNQNNNTRREEDEREIKSKKIRGGNVGCECERTPRLPYELVLEIVRRLPAKKLYRCMWVSKTWYSSIRDPLFLEAYFQAHYAYYQHCGGLLISVADITWHPDSPTPSKLCLMLDVYYSPLLLRPKPFVGRFSVSPPYYPSNPPRFYSGVTNVVNGLLCIYEGNSSRVCNVYTRETMSLPDAPDADTAVAAASFSYLYYFGYDPVDGVYKLLRISVTKIPVLPMYSRLGRFSVRNHARIRVWNQVHILTLGRNSSWRKLQIGFNDPLEFPKESFLFDGILYWAYGISQERGCGLFCFDIKTEKFDFVRTPQEPLFTTTALHRWQLARFKGRLAVTLPDNDPDCLVMHTLDNYERGGVRGGVGDSSWSRHVIPFPPGFGGLARFYTLPVGNLPTGQILWINTRFKSKDTPVYSYDHRNNKFEKFFVGKLPFNPDLWTPSFSILYTLEENKASLNVLFNEEAGHIRDIVS